MFVLNHTQTYIFKINSKFFQNEFNDDFLSWLNSENLRKDTTFGDNVS